MNVVNNSRKYMACVLQNLVHDLRTHRRFYSSRNLFKSKHNLKQKRLVFPIFMQAENHLDRKAVVDEHGVHMYKDIINSSYILADNILEIFECRKLFLNKERICFLCPNNVSYVVAQWATWISGGMAVPLCTSHPSSELQYFIEDSQTGLVLYTEEFEEKMKPLLNKLSVPSLLLKKTDYVAEKTESVESFENCRILQNENRRLLWKNLIKNNSFKRREALIIYTSGTTGKPKGVVHTHGSLDAQIQGMVSAWKWTSADILLHVLPLHHVHGLVNALMTPLYVGATCHMLPKFDAQTVWELLISPGTPRLVEPTSLFMAVPTIYAKLIQHFEEKYEHNSVGVSKDYIKEACSSQIRLMVSGSAALPTPVMSRWQEITGHRLLERYGMTETGMILTNSLKGPIMPGCVGNPFPEVEVCVSKPNTYAEKGYDGVCQGNHKRTVVRKGMENEQGELLVKGPNMFKCYWKKPKETKNEFTVDGWFKTGDTAAYMDGVYKILGRTSVDIIKSGGYKISALEVEHHLLTHPDIRDVAVLGVPDVTWGSRVAVVLVIAGDAETNQPITLQGIREFCKDKMADYKMPSLVAVVETMPRNAMGKVNKKDLLTQVFAKELRNKL